ncbi:MAG: glycoside hydrolase family 2 [Kiritimatiellae bacterium]|nr:glycoside hydrolase family 2 [Kiritimatiellia bacterium]
MKTLLFAALAASAACGAFAMGNVELNGEWELKAFPQPDDGAVRSLPLPADVEVKTYRATVPGCCEMELVKAGELPDPLFGKNCFAFRAYEGHQWLYAKTFKAPPKATAGARQAPRHFLVFDGIDTLADVFLNGAKIGSAENMFIRHEFDVTGALRYGETNTVAVLIRPVGLEARKVTLGELGGTMAGGADHEYFRKAPHMYGWDIMPHLPVSGIWKDVRLEERPLAKIDNVAWIVKWLNLKNRTADLTVQCRIDVPFRHYHKAIVRTTLSRNGKVAAVDERLMHGAQFRCAFRVENAEFWWPRGAGAQPLYDARIELVGEDGRVLAANERRVGLRTVDLDCSDIRPGSDPGKFLFRINYTPIYVRGVNWVPLDPIPSRQRGLLKDVLPMMADLNCNMVRVWGGGVYEPDAFFDWCDENGVMVWQDFMMACTVPPQDDGFAAKMSEEVLHQVMRLRDHASLVLWAGDNENDQAGAWTLDPKHRDPNSNRITRKVIPDILKEYDVTRPYLPSSPYISCDAFAKRATPAEDHLWGGARGWWKTDYYVKTPYWFCSEGGSHAVPCRESLERMMGKSDAERPWKNPDSASWRELDWNDMWHLHATCPFLDRKIDPFYRNNHVTRQCAALFGEVPRHDLDLFIAESQTAQAESIKFQVELFRSEKFTRRGGYIVWNLRDGWPTVSDAICDYYGTKKKSYQALKTAFQDVLVMVTEGGKLRAVNDLLKPVKGNVRVTEAKDGKTVFAGPFEVAANAYADIADVKWDGQGMYLIEWTSDGGDGRNHYLHGEPPFAWSDYNAWAGRPQK